MAGRSRDGTDNCLKEKRMKGDSNFPLRFKGVDVEDVTLSYEILQISKVCNGFPRNCVLARIVYSFPRIFCAARSTDPCSVRTRVVASGHAAQK
ncbi:hypothetical protein EVAR_54099_1 [Eumeta japonica]|uniref:Uncharacterized protein n=1 Tax=Eumeta variegata TaxID=151549 RepID=A0A4C1Z639_EUMVA|nr:hypothetical protein EVAR_54099_1 [Eumeta japonica]